MLAEMIVFELFICLIAMLGAAPRYRPQPIGRDSRSRCPGAVGWTEPMEVTMQSTEPQRATDWPRAVTAMRRSHTPSTRESWRTSAAPEISTKVTLDPGSPPSRGPAGGAGSSSAWSWPRSSGWGPPKASLTCGRCSRRWRPTTRSSPATSPMSAPGSRTSSPRCWSIRTTGSSPDTPGPSLTASRSSWPSPRARRRSRRPGPTSSRPAPRSSPRSRRRGATVTAGRTRRSRCGSRSRL